MQLVRVLAAVVAIVSASAVAAQQYPARPIKVLHGFAAGGPPDITLRQIALTLGTRLGTAIVVENRPGASGTIAASAASKAPPDGYTLLFAVAANLAVAPAAMAEPPYDPVSAFAPIIEVARAPYVWLVRADAPARTLEEFLQWAKQSPSKLNYASPGQGTVHHLATEMLKRQTGIDMVHVPYTTGLYQAMLGGSVDAMFESMPGPLPYLTSGKLRAIAVTGNRRLSVLPDVPTLAEQGVAGVNANSWWGFVGPKGLPPAIVRTLNAEITRALHDPAVEAVYAKMGIETSSATPEDFGAYIADEYKRWREFMRTAGLKIDS